MGRAILAAVVLSLPFGAVAVGRQNEPPDVNFQFKVDQAIDKGMGFLKGKRTGSYHQSIENGDELILLTFLHAGAPEGYPDHKQDFDALLKYVLESKLERTYKVALTAMCLEEYDRAKYQWRIHQCGQFLADNISDAGESRYGQPTIFADDIKPVPTGDREAVKTAPVSKGHEVKNAAADPHRRQKPPVKNLIQVKRQRPGPADHDHSNMQYHALGLRAAHDAGIRFEASLLKSIENHWRGNQIADAGAKEELLQLDPPPAVRPQGSKSPGSTKVTYAEKVAPAGWSYTGNSPGSHGSMTVGAVGALCILDYMLGADWRKDKDVLEGLQWMNKHWSVTENPNKGAQWYYYYIYGIERAGMLFGTEIIGDHMWYREGAEQLLKDQNGNGSWGNVVDTCFAILFLRRATRRLDVATGDGRRR